MTVMINFKAAGCEDVREFMWFRISCNGGLLKTFRFRKLLIDKAFSAAKEAFFCVQTDNVLRSCACR